MFFFDEDCYIAGQANGFFWPRRQISIPKPLGWGKLE
jgi:hypothetical protein